MAKGLKDGCPYYCGSCGDANLPLDLGYCRYDFENCQMYQLLMEGSSALNRKPKMEKPNLSGFDSRLAEMNESELEEFIKQQLDKEGN